MDNQILILPKVFSQNYNTIIQELKKKKKKLKKGIFAEI